MVINSRFESCCPSCEKTIKIGEQVKWEKGKKAIHLVCISKEESERVKTMSDSQLVQAVVAMANTVGQKVSDLKRKSAYAYKAVLVKEWDLRHGEKAMF